MTPGISNSSPIIVLAKAGRLVILEKVAPDLLVPEPVAAGILAGPPDDSARIALERNWGRRVAPTNFPPRLLGLRLGVGETSVLAAALERTPCTVVLDDAGARAAARTFGIPTIGTLGVIVRAKMLGVIPSAADTIRDVRSAGLYVDDHTIREVLAGVGENWP